MIYDSNTLVEKTWKFSMLHRCVLAKFLIKHGKFREHTAKNSTKHPCNMQIFPKLQKVLRNLIKHGEVF